jgi:pimeloyl-ACP methyl ester carboxylesterase
MRLRALLVLLALFAVPFAPAVSRGDTGIVREAVSFKVTNPLDPGHIYTIHGRLIRPRVGCSRSVLLAMHGLSYGAWAWDFPIDPERYSVAQALAARGYALLTVDRLGYGKSAGEGQPDHPNGYTLTSEGYGYMASQMVRELRTGLYSAKLAVPFQHVGLIGHSAGSEAIELATEFDPGLVDVFIQTAYTHEPFVNNDWLLREWSQDNLRAMQSDYEYFETNPTIRASDMHWLPNMDPKITALDNQLANLTPSGEVFSNGPQLSRLLLARITMPVLLVLADHDELFPGAQGDNEMSLFSGASDKTLLIAPNDGHAFMLQKNAPATNTKIADWLDRHAAQFPTC